MERQPEDMTQVSGGTSTSKELCLLSLDGGGIKGLSSLLILRRLMENINPTNPPKPSEHFDMICGTSTGGLIAIMLGRLRLSVQECIDEYLKLSPLIFVKAKHRLKFDASVQGRFDHEAFERGIRNMLVKYGFSEDALFREEQADPPCKVFVCATSYAHRGVVILSNYYSDRRDSELWSTAKIWEVARATSAAPTFFDPITISGEMFGDGALGANNPVQELEEEAKDVWGRRDPTWNFEANVRCLVSVGTGKLALEPFHETFWSLKMLKSLQGILTETEKTANHFHKIHTDLFQNNHAFRFNVDQGLEEVGLEETNEIDNIKALTRNYIGTETVYVAFGYCVQQLKDRGWILRILNDARSYTSQISKQLQLTSNTLELFTSCSHTSSYVNWKRETMILVYDKVKSDLSARHNQKSASYITAGLIANGEFRSDRVLRVYYINCNPQLRTRHSLRKYGGSPTLAPTRMDEILRSLTLQALDQGRETFLARYMRSTKDGKSLQELLDSRDPADHEVMKLHFISHLRALSTPAVIAVDNVDDAEDGCGERLVAELSRHFQDVNEQIKFIVSASHPDELPFGIPVASVWNTLEYSECLELLRRRVLENRRREDICDAEPETVNWIWHHKSYTSWNNMDAGILWIEGKPGSGKSVLAKSVSSRHRKKLEAERDRIRQNGEENSVSGGSLMLLSDWYYSTRGNDTAQNHRFLFQALLFQWLQQNPAIFPLLLLEYRQHEPLCESWINVRSLGRIVRTIVEQGIPILSIVDAMDESENRQDSEIQRANVLRSFLEMVAEIPQSKAKFIVLSRPTPEIENQFSDRSWKRFVRKITMQENNSEAISKIVGAGMRSLRQQMEEFSGKDPYNSDVYFDGESPELSPFQRQIATSDSEKYEKIRSYLLENADGVILWVTLIIETLRASIETGEDNFTKLEKKLYSLPRGLSNLYQQIIDDLCNRLPQDAIGLARQTLMWVSRPNLAGPIPLGALYEAVHISSYSPTHRQNGPDPILENAMQPGNWNAFRARLRTRCGPFLDVVIKDKIRSGQDHSREIFHPKDTVQLIHRTVKDFLSSPKDAAQFHFTDDAAARAVDEDIARYFTCLKRGFEHSMRDEGAGTYPERRREAVDDILSFFERRTLLSFLIQSRKLDSDAFSQCGHYILSRLSPRTSELDISNVFLENNENKSLTEESLLAQFDPSNAKDIGEFFALLVQNISIRLGVPPVDPDFSVQPSWEERYLLDLIFAELTYHACIKGLPNVASILVNLWYPKVEGTNYLIQQQSAQRLNLAAVAFLVTLEHGPTAICRQMWSHLKHTCIDWVCMIWHTPQKTFPGEPAGISLAEKLAIKAGHVGIIDEFASKLWPRNRHDNRHDNEKLEKRMRTHRIQQQALPQMLLSAFVVIFFVPFIFFFWFVETLTGKRMSRYRFPPLSQSQISFDSTQASEVSRPLFKGKDLGLRNHVLLWEMAREMRNERTAGQGNATRDEISPSPSIEEALSVVVKHDAEMCGMWRKTKILAPLVWRLENRVMLKRGQKGTKT